MSDKNKKSGNLRGYVGKMAANSRLEQVKIDRKLSSSKSVSQRKNLFE